MLQANILAAEATLLGAQAVKRLLQASQSKDKTLNEVPDGYHELLMGPEKEQVTATVAEWILAHAGSNIAKM